MLQQLASYVHLPYFPWRSHCSLLQNKWEGDAPRLCRLIKKKKYCLLGGGGGGGGDVLLSLLRAMQVDGRKTDCETRMTTRADRASRVSNAGWQDENTKPQVFKYTFIYTVKQIHFRTSYKDSL